MLCVWVCVQWVMCSTYNAVSNCHCGCYHIQKCVFSWRQMLDAWSTCLWWRADPIFPICRLTEQDGLIVMVVTLLIKHLIKVFVLLFMVGVLGGTHSRGHPGRRSVWVPVLPWPWGQEEAEAGLSEGRCREIQRGGDGGRCYQAGLHPHHLWSGETWEKRSFPGLDRRSAVFSMTITRTGNGDQSVEQNDSLTHPSWACPPQQRPYPQSRV